MKKKGTNMKPNTAVPLRWFVMLCAIWYHLYIFKNVKYTHRGVSLMDTWTFGYTWTFFKLFKWFKLEHFFSTQRQCCLTFSWIELQMLLRSCLIHMSIIILRHVLYWLYLHPWSISPFMLYCDLLFFFIFIFIMINLIVSWILVLLLYYFWMITWMKNVNNFQKASSLLAF